MAALTGKTINSTYKDFLQISNSNAGVDTTARAISDGEGTATILYLSSLEVYSPGRAGSDNTIFGKGAGNGLASGCNFNTVYGGDAGNDLSDGALRNTAIGYGALDLATSADDVTAIGANAMGAGVSTAATSGTTVIGSASLQNLTSGVGNTAIGSSALNGLTTGDRNIAIGYEALLYGTTETDDNIAIGFNCMSANFSTAAVNDCIAIGTSALLGTLTADASGAVAVGYKSLTANTSGEKNVAVGYQAGNTLTTGGENTVVGYDSDTDDNSATNQTVIGSEVTGVADNSVTLGNSSVTAVYMAQDSGATVHCTSVTVKETTTPSALADHGKIYTKNDNKLYFQDGAGTEHEISFE